MAVTAAERQQARKRFFLKKKQKLWLFRSRGERAKLPITKVFWFFFSKKNDFLRLVGPFHS
jgi:hypothetical protein